MFATRIRKTAIVLAAVCLLPFALAQEDGGDGGLYVGPPGGTTGSGTADATLEELRTIHARLGDLIARLGDGTQGSGGGDAALRERVARLEDLVRRTYARDAQRRLESLRSDLGGDADPAEIRSGVEGVRADLERAYAAAGDADVDEQALGREVTTNFDALVEMLDGGGDPQEAFDAVEAGLEGLATGDAASGEGDGADDGAQDQEQDDAGTTEAEEPATDPQVLGAQIYATNCAACHQGQGEGIEGAYPALAGNEFVTGDPQPVIDVVLHGRGGMPSFDTLSDEEVAAVISHERSSWGNDAEPITPEMVGTVRGGGEIEEDAGPNFRPGAAN